MHPIMSRINPTPINLLMPPAVVSLNGLLSPGEVMRRNGLTEIGGLRLVKLGDQPAYQMILPEQAERRYFSAQNGAPLASADRRFAEQLARHFIGDTDSPILSVELLTQFDEDYLSVNRLLPVYRVRFDRPDGMRVYVETGPARLAALVDDRKAMLGRWFGWLHNWTFMGHAEPQRKTLASLFLGALLLSALSGLWMYVFLWQKKTLPSRPRGLRRLHRGTGIAVSLSALLFVVSAEWHLLGVSPRGVALMPDTRFTPAELAAPLATVLPPAASQINLTKLASGEAYYQFTLLLLPASEVHYIRANSGAELADADKLHAQELATQHSGLSNVPVKSVTLISKFAGEYGFINKRLPVYRVEYATPDHRAFYVETRTGALAAVVKDEDRMEGWSFSYLHKFHWLDFAGKDLRDLVMALFGLGNLLVAALGLMLFARRYRKRSRLNGA